MRRVLLAGVVLGSLLLVFVGREVNAVNSNLCARVPKRVEDLPPYGNEVRALPRYGNFHPPEEREGAPGYSGRGRHPFRSPDRRYVAVTTSSERPVARLLGLVWDAPWYHTVTVVEESTGRAVPVVSIKEAEPGSGAGHHYRWSKDSAALLMFGVGGLPENYNDVVAICLVYLPRTDELFRLTNCPALL
jgi:hypothetical protein